MRKFDIKSKEELRLLKQNALCPIKFDLCIVDIISHYELQLITFE